MKGLWKVILQYQLKQVSDAFIWLGHPALGAFDFVIGYYISWFAAGILVWLYVNYELSEERIIDDKAYVDIKDFAIGFVAAAIVLLAILFAVFFRWLARL